jgi:glycosyltransferase involved in cell wall biosynthesis
MVAYGNQPGIATVGAYLKFPDGTIQHAGVWLGVHGEPADHRAHCWPEAQFDGYAGNVPTNVIANTAACVLIPLKVWQALDGFDASNFPTLFNDVDFGIRAHQRGLRNVFLPHVRLMHRQSASHPSSQSSPQPEPVSIARQEERSNLYLKWASLIGDDPFYNSNLSLVDRGYALEHREALTWPREWRPVPRLIAHHADVQGCGEYRIIAPVRALQRAGRVMALQSDILLSDPELCRFDADTIVFQRQLLPDQIESLIRYRRTSRAQIFYEIDDFIPEPLPGAFDRAGLERERLFGLREALRHCDALIVPTPEMAEAYADYHDVIRVVPNYIEDWRWGRLQPRRRGGERPRVGWAGGSSHGPDLEMLLPVFRALYREVDFVLTGMCPDVLKPYVAEFVEPVPLAAYPTNLASLDLDLALAPLVDHIFNETKTNLRILEYGILGYPVVASAAAPYRKGFPIRLVENHPDAWIAAIRDAVSDRDALAREGDALREHIRAHWLLENNLDAWMRAWDLDEV